MNRTVVALFCLSLGACASTGSGFDWMQPRQMTTPPDSEDTDAAAIMLLDERETVMNGPFVRGEYESVEHVHRVIYIRSEKG